MKCPNCQFDLKNPGPNCPFCQFVLTPSPKEVDTAIPNPGGAEAIPNPGEAEAIANPIGMEAIPDPLAAHAAATSEAAPSQPIPDVSIPAEETITAPSTASHGAAAGSSISLKFAQGGGSGVKIIGILGVTFLAFKMGMFDNILALFGVGSADQTVQQAEAQPSINPDISTPGTAAIETPPPETPPTLTAKYETRDRTYDPLDDPRMKALNAEVEEKIAERDEEVAQANRANSKRRKQFAEDDEAEERLAARGDEEEAEEEYEDDWIFKGRIYDMISLKPVAKANLMLMDKTEQHIYTAESDAKGRFSFDVPSIEGGYRLVVDHAYYLADYYDEARIPFHKTPLNKRRQYRSLRPKHKPWIGRAKPLRRNIVLFPEIPDR